VLGRIGATVALAALAGLILSLRDLVIPPPRQFPIPLGDLVLLSWLFSLAIVGWFAAQVIDGPVRIVVAIAAAAVALGVALVSKQLRYPESPLVGDGFEVLIVIYAAVALFGAALGSLPALRAKSRELAGGVTAAMIVVAGVAGAVPYVLAR
jgi:hypothetical protein